MPNITNHVRRLRFEANEMSQQALADAVGVTRQTIIAIEKTSIHRLLKSHSELPEFSGAH